ncbi:extracellular mutant protein 11-domain-containing protein [Bisporella sp. PMI_857]|nr:extracellular mutant protein 11-domain-containing protein [Bisporella sp. PMI_857]
MAAYGKGVNAFINQKDGGDAQISRSRQFANSLKVGKVAATSSQPAPEYTSNHGGARNTLPSPQYLPHKPAVNDRNGQGGGVFDQDNTLTSTELESTEGNVDIQALNDSRTYGNTAYEAEEEYRQDDVPTHGRNGYNNYQQEANIGGQNSRQIKVTSMTNPDLARQGPSRKLSPAISTEAKPGNTHGKTGISGRFQNAKRIQQQPMTLEHRPHTEPTNAQLEVMSRKRSMPSHAEHFPQPQHKQEEASFPSDDDGSDIESASDDAQPVQEPPISQEPDLSPYHNDDSLIEMSFSDLKNESWDEDPNTKSLPNRTSPPSSPPLTESEESRTLEQRFVHIIKKYSGKTEDPQHIAEQSTFFSSLPLDEWDEAGDLFIGRFGDIMNKLKNARQAKRQLFAKAEQELEERERLIKGKSGFLDERLGKMRTGGIGVLQGNVL